MLDTTLQMSFNPGSNRKGQVAGANWSFLLPNMHLKRILCIGMPSLETRQTITQCAQEVMILTEAQPPAQASPHTVLLPWGREDDSIPERVSNSALDLVLISGREMIRKLDSRPKLRAAIQQLLHPRSWVYLEADGLLDQLSIQKMSRQLADDLGRPHFFWSMPFWGGIQTAVPAGDQDTIRYFIGRGIYQPESKPHLFAQGKRRFQKLLLNATPLRRQSILISHPKNDLDPQSPPEYLCALAGQAGIDIHPYRWGLVAHGEYSTRKVLFYLFKAGDENPEFIVKLVRNSAYNARLENEYHALCALGEAGGGTLTFLPKPVFFGYHNDLAILAETAVVGKSFRKWFGDHPDSPCARLAVQHLIELGAATIDPVSTPPAQAVETLRQLFAAFIRIYQPAAEVQTFLEEQLASIACLPRAFPLVFQHGDPGAWNMLVTQEGEVVFLDWEAAETRGVPLWDLFYFLRSYAVGLARRAGIQDALKGFDQQFLSDSSFHSFAVEALHDYCQRLHLPADLVPPLFYTCWMHRSLKEANRFGPDQLQNGHYYNLLRLCIQKSDHPQMTRLFGAGF